MLVEDCVEKEVDGRVLASDSDSGLSVVAIVWVTSWRTSCTSEVVAKEVWQAGDVSSVERS